MTPTTSWSRLRISLLLPRLWVRLATPSTGSGQATDRSPAGDRRGSVVAMPGADRRRSASVAEARNCLRPRAVPRDRMAHTTIDHPQAPGGPIEVGGRSPEPVAHPKAHRNGRLESQQGGRREACDRACAESADARGRGDAAALRYPWSWSRYAGVTRRSLQPRRCRAASRSRWQP